MADDPEIQNSPEEPSKTDPDQSVTEDLASMKKEDPPHSSEEPLKVDPDDPSPEDLASMEKEDPALLEDDPLKVDPDQPLTEDLASMEKEDPSPLEEENISSVEGSTPGKFAFLRKQPLYIKIIASLLALGVLVWFALPKNSASTPLKKNFLVALNSNWHPLQLMTKEKDMTTFCKVLFEIIAVNQGLQIYIMETNLNLFPLLDRGTVDGVISILPPPIFTNNEYLSSDPFYQLGAALVVRKSSTFSSSSNVDDGHIGIIGNAKIVMEMRHLPSTIFTMYENPSRALADLDNGTIDGVIMDTLQAGSYLQGLYAGKFKILPPLLVNEGISLYLLKDDESEKFLSLFNQGLQTLRANGVYQALINRWGLINTDIEGLPSQ